MTVGQDEKLKGVAHGLLAGCALPILLYNIKARNWRNVGVYVAFLLWEGHCIHQHATAGTDPRP